MGDFEALTPLDAAAPGDPVTSSLVPAGASDLRQARRRARSRSKGIPWAERIEDPARRTLTLVQIARRWHQRDPAAAEAWLAQSPLSEPKRASAAKSRSRRPRRVESAGGAS